MNVYKDQTTNDQVDGPNALTWWQPVPFALVRAAPSNALGGTATDARDINLNVNSLPALSFANGDTDSAFAVTWVADGVEPVAFQVPLPPFLNPHSAISIKFVADMGGTTDSLTVAADTYFDQGDTKVEDTSGTVTGTVPAEYTITIGTADIPAGAKTMTVELTPGGHSTDTLVFHSLWVEASRIP